MLSLLNPAAIIAALPYVAIVAALGMGWNALWENPRIRTEARTGYVQQAELAAARAQLVEAQRQALATVAAADAYTKLVAADAAKAAEATATREKELTDYEKQIKADKRSCPLSNDDVRRLNRRVQ